MAEPSDPPPLSDEALASALPSVGARVLAVVAIVVAGACGGLIGYSVADLQCVGDCTVQTAIGGIVGAVLAAVGVAVVAVLVLRAMGEWRLIQHTGDPKAPRQLEQARNERRSKP